MPDLTQASRVTPIPSSVLARAAQVVRYVISGVTPQTWFGPLQPLKPFAPEGTGGRGFDYPVGYNLQYSPRSYEPISFADLHALADNCDMLRIIIESRKDQIEGQEWEIRPRKLADGTHPKASSFNAEIKAAKDFFEYPDKEHALPQWLRAVGEEVFVTDAASIYVRPDRKGRVYGFEVIDGSTVAPRIDAWGRTPQAPDVAYQQILHGVPAADFSRDQLIYFPRNRRPGHVYGYSPVEQIILTANTLIRREMHQLAYYTDGNLTDGIFEGPKDWSTDNLKAWQNYWNSLFVGNLQSRRQGIWVPNGVKYQSLKPPNLKDPYDEFLARLVCFAFKVSPQPFVSMMNRATADTAHDAAIEEGLSPILNWYEDLFRRMFNIMGWRDIEMVTVDDRETDPQVAAAIDVADVKAGVRPINEVRAGRGLDPIEGGDIAMVETATGYVRIDANVQPNNESGQGAAVQAQPGDPKPGNGPAEKLAKAKARIVRKLKPVPLDRPVVRGARESMQKRILKALKRAGTTTAAKFRNLGKSEEDPNRRAAEIAAAIEFEAFGEAADDIVDDLAAVMAGASQIQLVTLGFGTNDQMFGQVNARAAKIAAQQAAELVTNISESTRNALRDLIAKGLANGDSIADIADSIQNMTVGGLPAFGEARAALIAQTEVRNANEAGALQGLKSAADAGVPLKKTWEGGGDPCEEICQPNIDQGPIDLDDDFDSGDDAPPGHPRCECALGAEVEESAGEGETELAEAA